MFQKQAKKLIIVTDEKNKPYANYLMALVSAKDDKDGEVVGVEDGSVEAVVWSEKVFKDNEPTLSSNAHILFLGDSKLSKTQRSGLVMKYDNFGMKYGWLGKRAVMYIDRVIDNVIEYNNFFEFSTTYQENFTKAIERKTITTHVAGETLEMDERDYKMLHRGVKGKIAAALAMVSPLTTAVVAMPVVAHKGVEKLTERKKVIQQQQSCLTMLFYLEGLSEFLEG